MRGTHLLLVLGGLLCVQSIDLLLPARLGGRLLRLELAIHLVQLRLLRQLQRPQPLLVQLLLRLAPLAVGHLTQAIELSAHLVRLRVEAGLY